MGSCSAIGDIMTFMGGGVGQGIWEIIFLIDVREGVYNVPPLCNAASEVGQGEGCHAKKKISCGRPRAAFTVVGAPLVVALPGGGRAAAKNFARRPRRAAFTVVGAPLVVALPGGGRAAAKNFARRSRRAAFTVVGAPLVVALPGGGRAAAKNFARRSRRAAFTVVGAPLTRTLSPGRGDRREPHRFASAFPLSVVQTERGSGGEARRKNFARPASPPPSATLRAWFRSRSAAKSSSK